MPPNLSQAGDESRRRTALKQPPGASPLAHPLLAENVDGQHLHCLGTLPLIERFDTRDPCHLLARDYSDLLPAVK